MTSLNFRNLFFEEIAIRKLGYNPRIEIKPAHLANGLFRAICGGYTNNEAQHMAIYPKAYPFLRPDLIYSDRKLKTMYQNFSSDQKEALDFLNGQEEKRAMLNALLGADKTLYRLVNTSSYSLSHASHITNDNHDRDTGHWLFTILKRGDNHPALDLLSELLLQGPLERNDELSLITLPLIGTNIIHKMKSDAYQEPERNRKVKLDTRREEGKAMSHKRQLSYVLPGETDCVWRIVDKSTESSAAISEPDHLNDNFTLLFNSEPGDCVFLEKTDSEDETDYLLLWHESGQTPTIVSLTGTIMVSPLVQFDPLLGNLIVEGNVISTEMIWFCDCISKHFCWAEYFRRVFGRAFGYGRDTSDWLIADSNPQLLTWIASDYIRLEESSAQLEKVQASFKSNITPMLDQENGDNPLHAILKEGGTSEYAGNHVVDKLLDFAEVLGAAPPKKCVR